MSRRVVARLLSIALIVLAAATLFARQIPDSATIRGIGSFTSGALNASHTFGYEVQLWRQGDSVIGFLIVSGGRSSEPPVAELNTVAFNPQTGEISFTAALPIDLGEQCQHFRFVGRLLPTELVGTLEWVAPPRQGPEPPVESLHLLRNGALSSFQSYREWKQDAQDRLKLRGTCS